jgi:UDP-N-acetylmuramoyl-tripeptide--D-alanyl-D-alanine ligase
LAIVQQKEYRFDRIWLFLQTSEGIFELYRLIGMRDYTRTGFKRPKLTVRSLGTGLLQMLVSVVLWYFLITLVFMEWTAWTALGAALLTWLLVPLSTIAVATLPGLFVRMYSIWLLLQAAEKIEQGRPIVIGITGSYGKTATKLLLAHVLAQKYSVFSPPRSHNTILSISQSIIADYSKQQLAIIEYAAYKKGEIGLLASQLHPEMAILTGLTEQHLGLFGSLAKIIAAKSELVAALRPGATVYCANEASAHIAAAVDTSKLKVVRVWDTNQITGTLNDGILQLTVGSTKISTQFAGLQYRDTVRTVYQVALDLGLTHQEIVTALESYKPASGFTRIYNVKNGTRVLDDGGTSNPTGFEATLDLAEQLRAQKKILVTSGIVDLGERSTVIHRQLALQAKATVQEVWYVGQVGSEEFKAVFGAAFVSQQAAIVARLAQVDTQTLLVIEGRMPAWFTKSV